MWRSICFGFACLLPLVLGGRAWAGGPEHVAPVTDPLTARECGECHMAYPPALLPAASWATLMNGLNSHFGDSAVLPADQAAKIRTYLMENAGGGDPAAIRITQQSWWQREHRRAFRAAPGAAPRPSDCAACHKAAGQGFFGDD